MRKDFKTEMRPIETIMEGGCFKYGNKMFIRIWEDNVEVENEDNCEDNYIPAVELEHYYVELFECNTMVELFLETKIVIE